MDSQWLFSPEELRQQSPSTRDGFVTWEQDLHRRAEAVFALTELALGADMYADIQQDRNIERARLNSLIG